MRAYSVDLRRRVLVALDQGMARREVVTTFGISLATLKRLLVQRQTMPDLLAKRPGGRQPSITPDLQPALWAQLEAHNDATLDQQATLWNTVHGTSLSRWTLGRAIRHLGWTRKKRRWVPPSETSHSARPFALT